jgi:hypothetical protein
MPQNDASMEQLQAEKPQTAQAVYQLIAALASLPQDDQQVATLVTSIASQISSSGSQPSGPETIPQPGNNSSSGSFDRAGAQAATTPVQSRPITPAMAPRP